MTRAIDIASGEAMTALGVALAALLHVGDVVLLHGDLGAGKTTLTQGIAKGLGIEEPIQSPTFTIVAEHEGREAGGRPVRLYHLDLYRLVDPSELESFGYEHFLAPPDGITVIEWPERAADWLPDRFLLVRIDYRDGGGRHVSIEAVPNEAWSGIDALLPE